MAPVNTMLGAASSAALGSLLALAPIAGAPEQPFVLLPFGEVGSGGVATPGTVLAKLQWTDTGGNVAVRIDKPLTAREQLAFARSQIGLSITDLAELLDVARPTVYSWMQGAEPRDEHSVRLHQLAQQAQAFERHGLAATGRLLKRPLRDGSNLLELLKSNHPLDAALSELAIQLSTEARQRASDKGRSASMSAAHAADLHSMPGFASEA